MVSWARIWNSESSGQRDEAPEPAAARTALHRSALIKRKASWSLRRWRKKQHPKEVGVVGFKHHNRHEYQHQHRRKEDGVRPRLNSTIRDHLRLPAKVVDQDVGDFDGLRIGLRLRRVGDVPLFSLGTIEVATTPVNVGDLKHEIRDLITEPCTKVLDGCRSLPAA